MDDDSLKRITQMKIKPVSLWNDGSLLGVWVAIIHTFFPIEDALTSTLRAHLLESLSLKGNHSEDIQAYMTEFCDSAIDENKTMISFFNNILRHEKNCHLKSFFTTNKITDHDNLDIETHKALYAEQTSAHPNYHHTYLKQKQKPPFIFSAPSADKNETKEFKNNVTRCTAARRNVTMLRVSGQLAITLMVLQMEMMLTRASIIMVNVIEQVLMLHLHLCH
eukprot:scaffold257286_cov68-Attheya_sp.AAC.1